VKRSALVTGGSRGIGAAVVRQLAERGVQVAFTYRSAPAAAEQVIDECHGLPGRVYAYEYDLRASNPAALVKQVVEVSGGLDSLSLNAGTWAGGRLVDIDPDTWWEVVEANLRGGRGWRRPPSRPSQAPATVRSPSSLPQWH
jgi:3-oxoacyl-[acyl-carrier protein] reductase